MAGEAEGTDLEAGQEVVLAEVLAGALAEAQEGLSAAALLECSRAAKEACLSPKGSQQTKGRRLPMGRLLLVGRLAALPASCSTAVMMMAMKVQQI